MIKVPKELRVGLLTLFCAVALYKGISFLKGSDFVKTTKAYILTFDRVDGLQEGNAVMLNGASVGIVKTIRLRYETDNRVEVGIEVQRGVKVDKEAIGSMMSSSLLGGKLIELKLGKSSQLLEDGDTLKSSVEVDLTEQIKAETRPLLGIAEKSIKEVNETMQRLRLTLDNVDKTLNSFATTSASVNDMLHDNKSNFKATSDNIVKLTRDFSKTELELRSLLVKMNKLGDTLNNAQLGKTIAQASAATDNLNKMLTGINQGKGTMGKLIKNDSLYKNLNATAASLDALLKDMKANPKRYVHFSVFGSKAK